MCFNVFFSSTLILVIACATKFTGLLKIENYRFHSCLTVFPGKILIQKLDRGTPETSAVAKFRDAYYTLARGERRGSSVKRVAFHSALPQIVYRPKVNVRFEFAALDYRRRFPETHPPGATSCGARLFAAGVFEAASSTTSGLFHSTHSGSSVYRRSMYYGEAGAKKKLGEKEGFANLSLNPADARAYLRGGGSIPFTAHVPLFVAGKNIY